jgi:hypothetical protein
MCSHQDGSCGEFFDPRKPESAVGVPFHWNCLEIFRKACLYRSGKISWTALYELGIQENHSGFKDIARDIASEVNHSYHELRRENIWTHEPDTEWVAANPLSSRYSIRSCYYVPSSTVKDPREQVFCGDYRLDVGSAGPGSLNYWGRRTKTWRDNINLQARPYSTAAKKQTDAVMKKIPRLLPQPSPTSRAAVAADLLNNPASDAKSTPRSSPAAKGSQIIAAPSHPPANSASSPIPPQNRDFISPLPAETTVRIFDYLTALEVATMRLVSRRFAEIPMLHFRHRIQRDMPWAWELFGRDKLLRAPLGKRIDYKEMFRLVDRTTGTGLGAVPAMRNRKRIWDYCDSILELIAERG